MVVNVKMLKRKKKSINNKWLPVIALRQTYLTIYKTVSRIGVYAEALDSKAQRKVPGLESHRSMDEWILILNHFKLSEP